MREGEAARQFGVTQYRVGTDDPLIILCRAAAAECNDELAVPSESRFPRPCRRLRRIVQDCDAIDAAVDRPAFHPHDVRDGPTIRRRSRGQISRTGPGRPGQRLKGLAGRPVIVGYFRCCRAIRVERRTEPILGRPALVGSDMRAREDRAGNRIVRQSQLRRCALIAFVAYQQRVVAPSQAGRETLQHMAAGWRLLEGRGNFDPVQINAHLCERYCGRYADAYESAVSTEQIISRRKGCDQKLPASRLPVRGGQVYRVAGRARRGRE